MKKEKNFYTAVYAQVKKIPSGKVSTYGEIAEFLGVKSSSRMVGYALSVADQSIPCHRVVNRFGALTGKHQFPSINLMEILLKREGITFNQKGEVNLSKHMYYFNKNPSRQANDSLVLDGGGTSLRAYLAKNGKEKLLEKFQGNFNVLSGDLELIAKKVRELCEKYPCDLYMVGLAGLTLSKDKQQIEKALKRLKGHLELMSDTGLWLKRTIGTSDGTMVILGTGSLFCHQYKGKLYQVGGYGKILGDPGSGYAIGQKALRLFLEMLDDISLSKPDKIFLKEMKQLFPNGRKDVLAFVYKKNMPLQDTARVVIKTAEKGSDLSTSILENETNKVKEMLIALRKRVPNKSLGKIHFVGGLVENKNIYAKMLRKKLKDESFTVR